MKKTFNLLLLLATPLWLVAQIPLLKNGIIVQNEASINTENLEFSPAFHKDGILFITTKQDIPSYQVKDNRIDKYMMSIYFAPRGAEGQLEKPVPIAGELLSKKHEGPLTFNKDGDFMYFTRNESQPTDNFYHLAIYSASKKGDKWGDVKELSLNKAGYNTCHPSINQKEDILFFASDRPGGFGGMDIYMVKKHGEDWGEAVNLGEKVNTAGNEIFPYIHPDGTLYFSSNGLEGAGKLDLFYTTFKSGNWTSPINLGLPFNSAQDDFGMIVDDDNRTGYFSSNRNGGAGEDDIYSFQIIQQIARNQQTQDVSIAILDPDTGQKLTDAEVTYVNLNDILLEQEKGIRLVQTDEDDTFMLKLDNPDIKTTQSTVGENGAYNLSIIDGRYLVNIKRAGYKPIQRIMTADELRNGSNTFMLEQAVDCIMMSGWVLNEIGERQVGASVSIVNKTTNQKSQLYTDAQGRYEYCLPCDSDFNIQATNGYNSSITESLTTRLNVCQDKRLLSKNLSLQGTAIASSSLMDGMKIELPNIYYAYDDAKILPDARQDLDAVVTIMRQHPDMNIDLLSHTDSRGTIAYNYLLSQRRAESAKNYLTSKGIAASRIIPRGYGESDIRNRCTDGVSCSEAEHQYNRRTEIVVSRYRTNSYTPSSSAPVASSTTVQSQSSKVNNYSDRVSNEPTMTENTSVQTGDFLVIAGTFSNADNAYKRLAKVKELGYRDAKIYRYESNKYHAVCVSTFYDATSANLLVGELKERFGLKSYVKATTK